jgi:Type IX secretion system protein PorV
MSRIATACLALVLLGGAFGSARAQSEAGAQSLLIAPGARYDALGHSGVAVASDANAIWWNPAALAFVRGHDAAVTYTKLVPDLADDVNFSHLSYVQRVEGLGGIGGSFGYLSYGKSEATDIDGNVIREFTSNEIAPSVAYGTDLVPNMGFGVGLKLVRVDLAPEDVTLDGRPGRGTTFAADFGWLYKLPAWKTSLAATISNIGPDIAYIDEDQADPLPRNVRIGAAYSPLETDVHRLMVTADAVRFLLPGRTLAVDQWGAGLEYEFNRLLALRIGYYSDPIGTVKDLTYGFGVGYRGFHFDFANIPQSEFLDRVNRFSAGYHF